MNKLQKLFVAFFLLFALFSLIASLINLKNSISQTQELQANVSEIDSLNSVILAHETEIISLEDSICRRNLLNSFIESKYDLVHLDNLVNLPDSIFFLILSESEKKGIPISIVLNVIDRESGFLFIANKEGSGAMGYFQVMPKTFSRLAARIGISEHTPGNNVRVGTYYLKVLHDYWSRKFSSERIVWRHVLAEFACGRGGMQVVDDSGRVVGHKIPSSVEPGISKAMKNY